RQVRASATPLTVCYDEYGCYTTASPYGNTLERPFNILPASPSVIGTRFFLYTRNTRNKREEISRTSGLGSWDASKPTKITAHGFLDLPYGNIPPWWTDMKNAFLDIVGILHSVKMKFY
ncbi:unnamed protein product, partial [Didymodactylos carnosus]